jgi:adenosine deaminase CECR1
MAATNELNDAGWEEAEGVPSPTNPFIQNYLKGRDALVQEEKKQRSGWFNQRIKATNGPQTQSD